MNTPETENDAPASALPADSAIPSNINRRSFIMRNAVIGAAAVMTGRIWTPEARAAQAAKEATTKKAGPAKDLLGSKMSPDLAIVKQSKGPVMTVVDEMYKV